MEPLYVTVAEARRLSGLGTTRMYELLGSGRITARKCGSRTLIDAASLRSFLEGLPRAEIRTGTRRAV